VDADIKDEIARLAGTPVMEQPTAGGIPTCWLTRERLRAVLAGLKPRFPMLYDLTVIDERRREHRADQPDSDFTLLYHLLSPTDAAGVRLKLPLFDTALRAPSIVDLWPAADWYEREAFDMFGVSFDGHPHLRRLLLPPWWEGHPLRKEYPCRATERGVFALSDAEQAREQEMLRFRPEEWGMARHYAGGDFMFLNLGPNHPSVHGVFRVVLQLDGEEIVDAVPDIGYHHRAAEKMGERQSWHTFIPYTDRVDYLGGVMNNLPYLLAVERLAGIQVPPRARVIRVMLAELFRIASHLVFYGTFAQDIGQLSPVFYMFTDRECLFGIIEAVCGGRMHPNWFRIGGVAQDLPRGWDRLVREFVDYLPARMDEYDRMVLDNAIVKARSVGVGAYDTAAAVEWGVTGPGLRATGLAFDLRKRRPYAGYDQFDFEVPVAANGDAYDRCVVRAQEIRQSLRIVRQCLENMPDGPYKAEHPLATPPMKEHTMVDIETLIHHFLGVSWGPVIPPGEAEVPVEATKGINSYYLVSDGGTGPYRARIRTPSFPHLQMIPMLCRGLTVADLVAILGSIDFVMADVDR
jgi:NADH-quinone oxidoreductase subunit C/D